MLNHTKMIITCPECATRYQIDASTFPDDGRDVKCTNCDHNWHQDYEGLTPVELFEGDGVVDKKPDFAKPKENPLPESVEENLAQDTGVTETPKESAPVSIEQEASRLMKKARVIKSEARRDKADNKARTKKIMLLASALVILCALGIKYRLPIVKQVPETAFIYEKIGLPVNIRGLEFSKVEAVRDFQDGIPILAIQGEVHNITDKMQRSAPLRYALYNQNNQEVYHWIVPLQTKTIGPNSVLPIAARLAAPPPEATRLEVRFVRK